MKNIHKIITLFLVAILVTSCDTDYDTINDDHTNVIGFSLAVDLELPLSENNPEINFPLPYFVSNATSSDRTFNVVVIAEETELGPESYSFDGTVTIPANEREGEIIFTALNVNLTNEFQSLVLAFEGNSEIPRDGAHTIK
jgi:hypothetical protein